MPSSGSTVSVEVFERIFEQTKNWGRWGADDQRGALNFIMPEVRAAAAALVNEGTVVSCALPLPVDPTPENPRPVAHYMTRSADAGGEQPFTFTGDFFGIAPHGFATSHIDALCHLIYKGQMYNGFPASDVTSVGARRNSIEAARDGIVSRGVLLDIPRLRGVPWLELGEAVHAEELEKAEAAAGIRVQRGDILLVRTGRHARRDALGAWNFVTGAAGLHPDTLPWLHQREIAVLGADGVSDPFPSPVAGLSNPIHIAALVAMGVHLLDNLYLDALGEACAARGRWTFLLTVAPLILLKGTASPVNPIAVF